MAKRLQAIRAKNKLEAMAKEAEAKFAKQSHETKDYELISIRDRLLLLASELPEKLMIHTESAEETFTIAFLEQLTDEQLEKLREAADLQKNEDVFLFFYTQHQGQSEHAIELKNFEGFDFSEVIKINFNGNTAPLLRTDSDCVHYVSVTFTLA